MRFDASIWRDRALKRAKRTKDAARLIEDTSAITWMSKIDDWARARGIKIEFTQDSGCWDPDTYVIEVSHREKPLNQVLCMLHECGHFLADVHCKQNKTLMKHIDGHQKSYKTRVAIINNEIEAWARGKKLADRLKLGINSKNYEQEAARWIMTYVRWAAPKSTKWK